MKFRMTVHNLDGEPVGEQYLEAPDPDQALVEWKRIVMSLIKQKPKIAELMGCLSLDMTGIAHELEKFTWAATPCR